MLSTILLGTPKSGGKGKTNKKVGLENGCYLGHAFGPRALGRFCTVFFRKKSIQKWWTSLRISAARRLPVSSRCFLNETHTAQGSSICCVVIQGEAGKHFLRNLNNFQVLKTRSACSHLYRIKLIRESGKLLLGILGLFRTKFTKKSSIKTWKQT